MQIIPVNFDSVLLFLYNSKLAYSKVWGDTLLLLLAHPFKLSAFVE